MSNKDAIESGAVPKTPRDARLKKPCACVKKTAKVESRRVIPGRLDAFYKTMGAKRLTPRKTSDSFGKITKRGCNPRWKSTNSEISRYKGRQSPYISRKTKHLPSVPKFSGPGKRIRVEGCPSLCLQGKKHRITKTPRSKRCKKFLNNIEGKSSDRLPKSTNNCYPMPADILRSLKPPLGDKNAAPGIANGAQTNEKGSAIIEACATAKKAAIECLAGTDDKSEQQKLTRQLNTQIKDLYLKIEGLNFQIQELAAQNETFQSVNAVLQATIKAQNSKVESFQLLLNVQQTKMEVLKKSISLNDVKLESKQRECENLSQRYELLEKKNEVLKMKLVSAEVKNGLCFTRNDVIRFDSLLDKIPDFSDLRIFQK